MNQYQSIDLAHAFKSYFTVIPALSEELRQETWRIRHEVYCRDLGWEPLQANGLETDVYDQQAIACLMRSVSTGAAVGCARLILCDPGQPQRLLPVEQACAGRMDATVFDPAGYDRSRMAEVSRLAVTREFRRRKGEAHLPLALDNSDFGDESRVRFPYIPVGLFLGISAMAEQLGLDKLLMLAEPRLVAHLRKLGFHIEQFGEGIDHHGLRIPAVIDQQGFAGRLHPVMHEIWSHVRALVADAFAGHTGIGSNA